MKTSLLALFLTGSLLSVVACSPQDPAVLTPQEKARFGPKGGAFNTRSQIASSVAPTYANFLLDRQSEMFAMLDFALKAVEGGGIALNACVVSTEPVKTENGLSFTLNYKNCRQGEITQNGRISFDVELDAARKVSRVSIISLPLASTSLSAFETKYQVGQSSALIRQQLNLSFVRVSENPLSFQIQDGEIYVSASVKYSREAGFQPENIQLKSQTLGQVEISKSTDGKTVVSHRLYSDLNYLGAQVNGQAKDNTFFDLKLSPVQAYQKNLLNTEVAGPCPERNGEVAIFLDYRQKLYPDKDTVLYSPTEVKIVDGNGKSSSSIFLGACDPSKAPGEFAGFNSIDWSKVFLFKNDAKKTSQRNTK